MILRRRLNGKERKPFEGRLSQREVATVISWLDENLEETGGLDTVAKLVNMDVFSFTRAFKAATGETAHQFLIARRIQRAQDMLRNTGAPLSEIAYACGFSSQAHMTTIFGKKLGITPGAWRKQVLS